MIRALALAAVAALLLGPAALAQPQPTAPAASPVTSLVDETTLLTIEADVPGIDPDAVSAWLFARFKAAGWPQKEADATVPQAKAMAGMAKNWLSEGARGRATKAYGLVMLNPEAPFALAIPDGDEGILKGLLTGTSGEKSVPKDWVDDTAVAKLGSTVVWGDPKSVAAVKAIHENAGRQKRPDLEAALAASAGGTVRAAFAPPEAVKGLMILNVPTLPPAFGGGPAAPVVNAFKHATLTVTLPTAAAPKAAIRLVVQARDAAGAARLKAVADAGLASVQKEKEFASFPNGQALLRAVAPRLDGDRLVVEMDDAGLDAFAKLLVPAMIKARENANRAMSQSNVRQVVMAIQMYAVEHKGDLPTNLPDDVVTYLAGPGPAAQATARTLYTHPATGRYPGYVYVKPTGKWADLKDTQTTVIVYEAHEAWPAEGIAVGFVDGHAENVADEAAFKKLLGGAK